MGPVTLLRLIAALLACMAAPAWAHHARGAPNPYEPFLLAALGASIAVYSLGVRALWRRAGTGRGITRGQAGTFAAAWVVLCVALASPLDAWSDRSFALHMAQHELLMAVAAPLLVLGRPLEAWSWGLAPAWRAPVAATLGTGPLARAWRFASDPLAAWTLHAIAIWAWHVPAFFGAALESPGVHVLQHASFLGTALFFWWSVLGRGARRPDGASLGSLFTTMLHSGCLGALITFAPTIWYRHYGDVATFAGLTPLEDQQLGGLVMWGPGGLAYLVAGLAIVGLWVRRPRAALR